MTKFVAVVHVASAFLLLSCGDSTGPEEVLEVGVVGFFNESDPFIAAPDTVDAGVPFALVARTYGNGCVRLGPTEVVQGASAAVVVPYDHRRISGGPCQDSLNSFDHETVLVFSVHGPATVTVEGRVSPGDTAQAFSRQIWVR